MFLCGTRFACVWDMRISKAARLALLSLLVVLPLSPAVAGDFSAVINGRSIHVDAKKNWNENNFGLGFEYQFSGESRWKKQLMVNGFRDSSKNMSYMAGGGIHRNLYATDRLHGFYVDAGVNAFLMTRQNINNNRPFPGALPSLTVGNRYMGLNLTYLPKKAVESVYDTDLRDEAMSGIFFLQFKVGVSELLPAD